MPQAPRPVNSAPTVPGQPYDSDAPGTGDAQSDPTHVYDATGTDAAGGGPWVKVQAGGAADWRTGRVTGGWPTDGTSDGSAWTQA